MLPYTHTDPGGRTAAAAKGEKGKGGKKKRGQESAACWGK